jgi:hypothetical protein
MKVQKCACFCHDGPMRGETLFLTDGLTATFTYRGQTGRYVNGYWQPR